MSTLVYVGIGLHVALFVALTGTCAFDNGRLASDWSDCLIPLGLLAVPLLLAGIGAALRSDLLLGLAAGTGVILAFVSITGPDLFVLVPAILYGLAAGRGSAEGHR